MTVPCEVDFLGISAYTEGTGRVRIVKDLDHDVHGRDVVLVEDIVDTGLTCTYVLGELRRRGPASLEVCTLFDRRVRRIVPVPVRFVGLRGHRRPAPRLRARRGRAATATCRSSPRATRETLESDPDAHVASPLRAVSCRHGRGAAERGEGGPAVEHARPAADRGRGARPDAADLHRRPRGDGHRLRHPGRGHARVP